MPWSVTEARRLASRQLSDQPLKPSLSAGIVRKTCRPTTAYVGMKIKQNNLQLGYMLHVHRRCSILPRKIPSITTAPRITRLTASRTGATSENIHNSSGFRNRSSMEREDISHRLNVKSGLMKKTACCLSRDSCVLQVARAPRHSATQLEHLLRRIKEIQTRRVQRTKRVICTVGINDTRVFVNYK